MIRTTLQTAWDYKWWITTGLTILGVLTTSWVYAELPRPAFTTDLDKLNVKIAANEQMGRGAYALIMIDKRNRLQTIIDQAQARLHVNPNDMGALKDLQNAREALSIVNDELRRLGIK